MADINLADLHEQLYRLFEPLAASGNRIAAAALFQLETACRVREMITLSAGQVTDQVTVFLVASKNSNSRYVTVPECIYFFKRSLANGTGPFIPIDYHQYSQWLRDQGINYQLDVSKRRSPTHILRYAKLHRMSLEGYSDQDIKNFVGHVSLTTTEEYLAANLIV